MLFSQSRFITSISACLVLLPPVRAAVGASSIAASAASGTSRSAPLSPTEELLLVLNRFTFGPQPGDLEKLQSTGLQSWFKSQLSPQTIDDSELDRRLVRYSVVQLPLPQLMAMYPNRQVIRKEMGGHADPPQGKIAKAIYKDSAERYQEKNEAKLPLASQGEMASSETPPAPQSISDLLAMSPADRFSALCRFSPTQLTELRRSALPGDRARLIEGLTPQQIEALVAFGSPVGLVSAEVVQTRLLREIYSRCQLNEVMVDFWLNYFNVYVKKSQDAPYYIASYERDVVRPRALGKFEDLLVATAGSPAMLNYLDNAQSVGPNSAFANRSAGFGKQKRPSGLNENYARELMELQTLGVNGGYSQRDVTEVAKVFTGWTIGSPERGGIPTRAEFNENKHEPGSKTVLGVKIKEAGELEGLQVLHLLATSPQTARFVSTKLAIRFVSDEPTKALVDRMANTFLSSKGDIRQVLLSMINSPEFFTAATYRAKVKTPEDFVLSAIRASGAEVENPGALASVIADLGMPVYGMQTPNGYSMKAEPWNSSSSLIARLNFALALSSNRVAGVKLSWNRFLDKPGLADDSPGKEAALEAGLLHRPASNQTRAAILTQISADPAQQEASLRQVTIVNRRGDPLALGASGGSSTLPTDVQAALAAGLLLGSPEFQRR